MASLWNIGRPFITGVDKTIESIQANRDVILSGNRAYNVISKKKIPALDRWGLEIPGEYKGYELTLKSKSGGRTETRTFRDQDILKAVDSKTGEGINGWKIAAAGAIGLGTAAYLLHNYKKTKKQLEEEDKKLAQLQALTNKTAFNPRSVSTNAITNALPLSNNVGYKGMSPSNVYTNKVASTAIK